MNFFKNIRDSHRKKQYSRMGLSIKSVNQIKRESQFIYEQRISLSQMNICYLPASESPLPIIGFLTYFRSGLIGSFQSIGRYCSFGPDVIIGEEEHPTDWLSTHPFQYDSKLRGIRMECRICTQSKQPPIIGNDVWVGARAIIMRGVSIGDGAIIGAGAIVTKDVPAYSIVVGIPAKIIKYRFNPEIIKKLSEQQWWALDPVQLAKVRFNSIEQAIEDIESIRDKKEFKPDNLLYTRKGIMKLQALPAGKDR